VNRGRAVCEHSRCLQLLCEVGSVRGGTTPASAGLLGHLGRVGGTRGDGGLQADCERKVSSVCGGRGVAEGRLECGVKVNLVQRLRWFRKGFVGIRWHPLAWRHLHACEPQPTLPSDHVTEPAQSGRWQVA
jgi:hypothetical protein